MPWLLTAETFAGGVDAPSALALSFLPYTSPEESARVGAGPSMAPSRTNTRAPSVVSPRTCRRPPPGSVTVATPEVMDVAVGLQHQLARRGQHRLAIPDLVISAAARAAGLVVLHYDADFERLAAAGGAPHEWVVPQGTI